MALTQDEQNKAQDAIARLTTRLTTLQASGDITIDEDMLIDEVYNESVHQGMTGGVQPHWLEWRTTVERALKHHFGVR